MVFVQLPDVGLDVVGGASISEIESTKSVSDVYVPLTGTVSAVNDALTDQPELVNSDPYGEGWMFEVELTEPSSSTSCSTRRGIAPSRRVENPRRSPSG